MKTLFVLIILIFSCLYVMGQVDTDVSKSNFFVGGSASYATSTDDNTPLLLNTTIVFPPSTEIKTISYSFRPNVGMQLSNNIALGLRLAYTYSNFNSTTPFVILPTFPSPNEGFTGFLRSDRNTKDYSGSLFLRYTLNPDNKLQFIIEPSINYTKTKVNGVSRSDQMTTILRQDMDGIGVTVLGGLTYEFSERFRLISYIGGISYEIGNFQETQINSSNLLDQFGQLITNEVSTLDRNFSSFTTNFRLSNIQVGVEFLF